MGICFSKSDASDHDRPVISSEDERLCIRKSVEINLTTNSALGLSDHFDFKEEHKKQVDSMDEADLLTSSPKSFFVCGVCGRDCLDSSDTTSDKSEGGHAPLQLVTANLSLSPLSKSCRMSSTNSRSCREDHESARSKFMGLLVNHLVKSLSPIKRNVSSGNRSVDTNSSAVIDNPDDIPICSMPKSSENIASTAMYHPPPCPCSRHYKKDRAKSLPRRWNVDIYSITTPKNKKTDPLLGNGLKKANRSKHGGFDDNISRVPDVDLPVLGCCERKETQSQSLGLSRSYSLSLVEGEKAFGSPFSVDSSNLCEGKKEKRRGRSSIDDWSDSSSDLFDLDFRKAERVAAGLAFSIE